MSMSTSTCTVQPDSTQGNHTLVAPGKEDRKGEGGMTIKVCVGGGGAAWGWLVEAGERRDSKACITLVWFKFHSHSD